MRSCPICNEGSKRIERHEYNGQNMSLVSCMDCGFRYVDGKYLDQEYFNHYYLTQYRTDDNPYSVQRWAALAEFVSQHSNNALDIGGLDGELKKYFEPFGVSCDVVGVGGDVKKKYDCVILSHVLEHVYDVGAFLESVKRALAHDGLLVIEIPIHKGYTDPDDYDNHWQHVNKFRPQDIVNLMTYNGFIVKVAVELPPYREYNTYRVAARL